MKNKSKWMCAFKSENIIYTLQSMKYKIQICNKYNIVYVLWYEILYFLK